MAEASNASPSLTPAAPGDVLWQSELPGLPPPRRGKVRDVYDLGDEILLVASDRLSAYDHVLRPAIPGKGKVLTQLSNFWFERLAGTVPHHLLATRLEDFPPALRERLSAGAGGHRDAGGNAGTAVGAVAGGAAGAERGAAGRQSAWEGDPQSSEQPAGPAQLRGRAVLVRKTEVVPFECVARGYLAGSGHREYVQSGAVCGIPLPPGLERASRLPAPIFTPATKAAAGHDENIDFATLESALGSDLATRLRDLTLELYTRGAAHASSCGLILADTKFEFGLTPGGALLLIDEVFTPDSSRYWDAATWHPGEEPASFDKQFVRNWLDQSGWDHNSPPPPLPPDVVAGTRDRYLTAFRLLAGRDPEL